MKAITTFLLFLIFYSIGNAQHFISQDFPSYESVVKHFYRNYNEVKELDKRIILNFEKRPEGYFVSISDEYPYDKRKNQEIFWSAKTKEFEELTKYKKGGGDCSLSKIQSKHFPNYIKHEFDFCPFAGYPGWQFDVIKHFEKHKELPDTLLYGLARAYTNAATGLATKRSTNYDAKRGFNLPKGKNAFTDSQLEKFRTLFRKGNDAFFRLHQQNPNFETVVGKIHIKYCNEVMNLFLQLLYIHNEEEARKELKSNLYNDFYINAAKNYLNSCPPNAILFTYGDNDTYPLLYVQAQLGFRTDVMVANTSLLQLDRYIDHLREKVFHAVPMQLPFNSNFYQANKNDQIIPSQNQDTSTLKFTFNFLKDEKNKETYSGHTLSIFPSKYISITSNKEKMLNNNILVQNSEGQFIKEIVWKSPQIMLKNDIVILGSIASNYSTRPICIAASCRRETFIGMNDYFHLEGMVYRFSPAKHPKTQRHLANINTDDCFDKLMNVFSWEGIDFIDSGKRVTVGNYYIIYYETALQLIITEQYDKAERLIDKYFEVFTNDIQPYDYNTAYFGKFYFDMGVHQKGEKIILQVIKNFSNVKTPSDKDIQQKEYVSYIIRDINNKILSDAFKKIDW